MPSSPKIPKEMILKNAMQILIRDGYQAVTIKTIAAEIGCSTQPISWHFGNMEGLRSSLFQYAREYAISRMRPESKEVLSAFRHVCNQYLCLAVNEPNLFRFLYLEGYNGFCANNYNPDKRQEEFDLICQGMQDTFSISQESACIFVENTMFYVHGIAAMIATDIIHLDEETAMEKVAHGVSAFLRQCGIDPQKLPDALR